MANLYRMTVSLSFHPLLICVCERYGCLSGPGGVTTHSVLYEHSCFFTLKKIILNSEKISADVGYPLYFHST